MVGGAFVLGVEGVALMDAADLADEKIARELAAAIQATRCDIPAGAAGQCVECGTNSIRLINGMCARCRDAQRPTDLHGGVR